MPDAETTFQKFDAHRSLCQIASAQQDLLNVQHALTRVKTMHNLSIPIGRLPDELILEVFKFGITRRSPKSGDEDWKYNLHPAYFTCSRWRRIAINTPSLWSTIVLPSPDPFFRLLESRAISPSLTTQVSTKPLLRVFINMASTSRTRTVPLLAEHLLKIASRISYLWINWCEDDYIWESEILRVPDLSEFFGVCLKGGDFSALKVLDIDDGRVSHGRMPGINAPLLQKMRFYADVTTFPKFTADGTPATNLLSLELEWSLLDLDVRSRLGDRRHDRFHARHSHGEFIFFSSYSFFPCFFAMSQGHF
ncbi:hypothetical protein SISNIDRAFT_467343 [Sistotremastrum niveocremeum HHB9708]|uniref:F-box domain-containing protein n=1 Tax=Sistotremastrum niveocremeum HHB9708 TaxID=1314777 RepID=A0A164SRM9_9AGAM|nr:hypothetical protein SISNIDRAFT_467343 [Sistotremastrum niveocremeum HHB9708]